MQQNIRSLRSLQNSSNNNNNNSNGYQSSSSSDSYILQWFFIYAFVFFLVSSVCLVGYTLLRAACAQHRRRTPLTPAQEAQLDADRRLAERLQREHDRMATNGNITTRDERLAWYKVFLKPYTMVR
jgi:hypothetical protein